MFDPGNRLIAALDVASLPEAEALLTRLAGVPSFVKIGLELFCAEGPRIVEFAQARGLRVMLDLKLHDIPETVARTLRGLARLGVELCTVHAAGGGEMLEAAVAAVGNTPTRVLAVTVLTSMTPTDLPPTGVTASLDEVVLARARLAVASGCHGVVASAHEAPRLRAIVPAAFLLVTPGIRMPADAIGDQKRIMSPAAARAAGADLLVVGRPLRDAPDPAAAARRMLVDLEGIHA